MDIAKILGVFAGVMIIVVPAIKWLVSDWYKKSKEIQTLRKKSLDNTLKELTRITTSHTAEIRSHELKLQENTNKLKQTQQQLKIYTEKVSLALNHNEATKLDVKEYVNTTIRSEVIALTKQLMLIRTKANGK